MASEASRVIVTTGPRRTRAVHHRDFPEIRAEGETPRSRPRTWRTSSPAALDTRPDQLAPRDDRAGDRRRPGVRRARSCVTGPSRPDDRSGPRRRDAHDATLDDADAVRRSWCRDLGPARRHDDRHGVDDRLGHLHHVGRVGPAGRRPRLAAGGLGPGRPDDGHRGASRSAELAAMMPRAGRPVRLPPRGLRADVRLPVRLVDVPGRPDRDDRGGRGRLRQVPGRVPARRSRPTSTSSPPLVLGHYALSLSTQQLVAVALIVAPDGRPTRGA